MKSNKYRFLFVEDDNEQHDMIAEAVKEFNDNFEGYEQYELEYASAKNEEIASNLLYKEKFDGIIVDLKLHNDTEIDPTEELSGNTFINNVCKKEFIPIVARTGTPDRINFPIENQKDFIKVYAKDGTEFKDIFIELISWNESSIYSIFGKKGEVNKIMYDLFWKVLPSNIMDFENLKSQEHKNSMLRYISNCLHNRYEYLEDSSYDDYSPVEMYIIPSVSEYISVGTILKNQNQYFLVLTPACELANHKTENVLLAEIISYSEVNQYIDCLNKWKNAVGDEQKKSKLKKLSKWFRNSENHRYHYLPKVPKFEGGFVDFQSLKSIKYDSLNKCLDDNNYKTIGTITNQFVKDIVARNSSYYLRQGQPELKAEQVVELLAID